MTFNADEARKLLDEIDNLLSNPDLANKILPEEVIVYFRSLTSEEFVALPDGMLADMSKLGFIKIYHDYGELKMESRDFSIILTKYLRLIRECIAVSIDYKIGSLPYESPVNPHFCRKCQDRPSISYGSLCRQCLHEINEENRPDNRSDLSLLTLTAKSSFDAFKAIAKKTGIYIRVDNRSIDEFLNPAPDKLRVFVQSEDLEKARDFLNILCQTAKIRHESLDKGISTATVSAAYLIWIPRSE